MSSTVSERPAPPMYVQSPSLKEAFPHVDYFVHGDPIGNGRFGLWGHCCARWYLLNCETDDPRWKTPIKPRHLGEAMVVGTIGRSGIEGIAENVINHLRKFPEWQDFTPAEVGEDVTFLAELGWIVPGNADGAYRATVGLVHLLFAKNPVGLT